MCLEGDCEMSSWHTYPSIYNLGHRAIADLLKQDVIVEEKIDGSQFSFGLLPAGDIEYPTKPDLGYELRVRSKGAVMHPDAPEKMFTKAVETVKSIAHLMHPGWTYRGEYLAKPHHNMLAYDRVPAGHIIIFDINTDEETYLSPLDKLNEAERIGLEAVPVLHIGRLGRIEDFRAYLETVSILGGQKIEGVVIKPRDYSYFGRDKKVLMGKFVSEAFREVQSKAWRADNLTGKDILTLLGGAYGTQARWQKAILHLREEGKLVEDVQDIGLLMKEIPNDIFKECAEEIKEKLFAWSWPHIRRIVTRGVPEWYKNELLKKQFQDVGQG